MMAARELVSQIREVPGNQRESYDACWERLRVAAVGRGAHAWRFVSSIHPHRYLEFLEYAADADPRLHSSVADALAALGREIGAADAEEWRELTA
jgi:hypothetical protein